MDKDMLSLMAYWIPNISALNLTVKMTSVGFGHTLCLAQDHMEGKRNKPMGMNR